MFNFWKKQPVIEEKPQDDTDVITAQVVTILHSDDNNFMMEILRDRMEEMTRILPVIAGESETQHIIRQDSLISLAVLQIHEDPACGIKHLIANENVDVSRLFHEVTNKLQDMNYNSKKSAYWAELATKTEAYHSTSQSL